MTSVSALNYIHKLGLFGNQENKNEESLLKISEIKNLLIVQIVQYKNSTVSIENLNIDSLKLKNEPLSVASNNDTRILWNAPKNWPSSISFSSKNSGSIWVSWPFFHNHLPSPPAPGSLSDIAPTQAAPVIVYENGQTELKPMRWGLIPHWADDEKIGSKLINARSETAAQKPAFREA